MLCLSARVGEKIVIDLCGEKVEVTVLETRGRQARLGFNAAPSVVIVRQAILDRVNKEISSAERIETIDEASEGDGPHKHCG